MCNCYECNYVAIDLYGNHYCNNEESDYYGNYIRENGECDKGKSSFKNEKEERK